MKEKGKKLSKKIIFVIVCAAVIGTILIACAGLQISFLLSHRLECWRPDYDQIDISMILDKQELSDEDYQTLYRQTGVTRLGVDRLLEHGQTGKNRLLKIQTDYFAEHTIEQDVYCPLVCTDFIEKNIANVYLREGDIIITSSTHISGWRIGHAALVVNAAENLILQASAYGESSDVGKIEEFTDRINFMIFSPKADAETKSQVVAYAVDNLIGLTYDVTAGVLTNKNTVSRTQCSHLVWYAYKQLGIDLDSNGGLVVTPKDIANSDQLELVQVFGFDPEVLWS